MKIKLTANYNKFLFFIHFFGLFFTIYCGHLKCFSVFQNILLGSPWIRVHSGGTLLVKHCTFHLRLSLISTIVKMYQYLIRKHASAATKAQHILEIMFISFNRITALHQHISQEHCNKMNQKCIECWFDRSQVEDKDIKYQKDTLTGR